MKPAPFVIVVLSLIYSAPAISAEWVHIEKANWDFDGSRIKTDRGGVKHVLVKLVLPSEDLSSRVEAGFDESKRFKNYDFTMVGYAVNCKKNTIGAESTAHYDKKGRRIYSLNLDVELVSPKPGSYGEDMFYSVCNFLANKELSGHGTYSKLFGYYPRDPASR